MRRVFTVYAVASLVPVVLLGVVLLLGREHLAETNGLAEARAQASLLDRTAIAPALMGTPLFGGLQDGETTALSRAVSLAIRDGDLLRVRLRDLDGNVVYASDNSQAEADDPDALRAAAGHVSSSLTRLNADDPGSPHGPRVVEVYDPVVSEQSGNRIGVLEMYLPYEPIAKQLAAGQRMIAVMIAGGLALLWLCLLLVSASVTRRLRKQSGVNAFLAAHDPLTGLPNRATFAERATQATQDATLERRTAVALVDLDRFKEVNDTLGHGNGDRLLVMLADRLRHHIRERDTVARLGGDEFGIILRELHGPSETIELLTRLRSVLAEPVEIDGLPLAVEASIGFTLAPDDGGDIELLLQRADVAMYVAKRQHLGVVHYRPEHDNYDASALTLAAELGSAISNDELVLHYQPKGEIRTGDVQSVEALVRWQHPTRGLLYPGAFLPAAEQTELIEPLTKWVLRTATAALDSLDPAGELSVAVNISARSLIRSDFADDVLAVLAETGADPNRVILELTETALLADPPRAARTLNRLHESGMRISIDDFGAGQTSLGYLAELPISELKIDGAFVRAMLLDDRNAAIVRSVIELGHSLGATVTAEGVDSEAALEQLRELNCDTVQGFLLSEPLPMGQVRTGLVTATARLSPSRTRVAAGAPLPVFAPEPGVPAQWRLELWRNDHPD
jgi:diguanylate cyclase (GGDEF)-like protein